MDLMKINRVTCKVLHLDLGNTQYQQRLRDEKLDMSQQCVLAAQKAGYVLDCIKRSIVSRSRKVICHLCSRETPPGVLHPGQGLPLHESYEPVRGSPQEGRENNQRNGTTSAMMKG